MKTFILDIIPKIQQFSKKLDNISVLTNKHWILVDELQDKKIVFIFREKNNQLLISENGRIEKATWDYLGENSLLVDRNDGSFLFRHGFIDDSVLALKVDGKDEYALLVNEQKFNQLNTLIEIQQFLVNNYEKRTEEKIIEIPTYKKAIKKFEPNAYLNTLQYDLKIIGDKLQRIESDYKAEILISYTRHRKINQKFVENNPEIVDQILSGKLPLNSIEFLFKENKEDDQFIFDLETYIREKIS